MVSFGQALRHLLIEGFLMVVVIAEGRVNLCKRQVRMLAMDFFCTPSIGDMIQRHIDHFDTSPINPRHAGSIAVDMRNGFGYKHTKTIGCTAVRVKAGFFWGGGVVTGSGKTRRGGGYAEGLHGIYLEVVSFLIHRAASSKDPYDTRSRTRFSQKEKT